MATDTVAEPPDAIVPNAQVAVDPLTVQVPWDATIAGMNTVPAARVTFAVASVAAVLPVLVTVSVSTKKSPSVKGKVRTLDVHAVVRR